MEQQRLTHKWQPLDWLLCLSLLALGMLARLWSLRHQSVWYDEYITLSALDAGGLVAALREELKLDWSMVPAYHILQYAWAHLIARSDYGIRWLSILLSAAAFPLLYAIARRLHGRWAAAIALLFLALAPYHIFHAQGIRNYPLALLAALASMYCFLRALDDSSPRKWWMGNLLANALLMWTHVFGIFLLAGQGLYLLLFYSSPPTRWMKWGAAHALVLAPVALWILLAQSNEGYPDVSGPTLARFNEVVFGHYTHPFNWMEYNVPANNEHAALGPLGAWLMERSERNAFISFRMSSDLWLRRAGLLAFGLFCLLAMHDLTRKSDSRSNALLLLWLLLPALSLFIMGVVLQRTVFQERYLVYAYPALYIVIGATLQRMPWRWAAAAGITLFGILLGLQTIAYQVVPIRPDYLGAARVFQHHAHAQDKLILHRLNTQWLFNYNLAQETREHIPTHFYDELMAAVETEVGTSPRVWVVLQSAPRDVGGDPEETMLAERFMKDCEARGWAYTQRLFVGMQNIWLFCVGEGEQAVPSLR